MTTRHYHPIEDDRNTGSPRIKPTIRQVVSMGRHLDNFHKMPSKPVPSTKMTPRKEDPNQVLF
jgi:hypothetical protein